MASGFLLARRAGPDRSRILKQPGEWEIKVSGFDRIAAMCLLTMGRALLPDKDIQAMVEYLQSMAGHKKPGSVCP
jgi:hypothetical protein